MYVGRVMFITGISRGKNYFIARTLFKMNSRIKNYDGMIMEAQEDLSIEIHSPSRSQDMPEECVSQPSQLCTQAVRALRTQPVCALRTQLVCSLRTQPVCALRTQPVYYSISSVAVISLSPKDLPFSVSCFAGISRGKIVNHFIARTLFKMNSRIKNYDGMIMKAQEDLSIEIHSPSRSQDMPEECVSQPSVLVEINGVNYDVYVHKMGTSIINIVDKTLDSSSNIDVNNVMEKVKDSVGENSLVDLNDLNELNATINDLKINVVHPSNSIENVDVEKDINKAYPYSKIGTSLDLSRPLSFEHMKRTSTILSGADNRPPMLEKDMYDSWKSRMELYMMNRQHGRMILESVENGPLIWPSIEENGVTRPKKYSELSATEAIQADCDIKATNIILQGLPPEVYALVSNHKVAKEL
ncbi:hypothetical protein Tco_1245178 [Tanacetum coccineum]